LCGYSRRFLGSAIQPGYRMKCTTDGLFYLLLVIINEFQLKLTQPSNLSQQKKYRSIIHFHFHNILLHAKLEMLNRNLGCYSTHPYLYFNLQGAANKSNPLPCFVNISTTNLNFYKKIYAAISHSYLHIIAKLCYIITTFDKVMHLNRDNPTFCNL